MGKMRYFLTGVFLIVFWAVVHAQNPNGYYNSANGKMNEELKTALFHIISKHTVLDYGSLWYHFQRTDRRDNGTVWDMYSNITRTFENTGGLNREHSFPKSWWDGEGAPYSDIFHIYPADRDANMAKSNYPLGVVGNNPDFDNGVSKVGDNVYPGFAGVVFEPADEYKGDFARTYFYMVTCYQDYYSRWRYFYMISSNTYPVLKEWAVNMLLEWHREDPVSHKELKRNEAVFQIQNNRNPFIDYPQLAEYIWGNKTDQVFYIDTDLSDPVLATPTNDTELNFGTLVTGQTSTLTLYVRGSGLVGDLGVMLYGKDSDQFDINTETISSAIANGDNGYELQVTYHPLNVNELHSAKIAIYDGGIEGSIAVNITGTSIAPESLSPPVAEEATNVTSTGFTANWQPVAGADGYILNVYVYDETTGDSELVFDIEIEPDVSSMEVSNLQPGKSYTYFINMVKNSLISAPSETIMISTTSIREIERKDHIVVWTEGSDLHVRNNKQVPEEIKIFSITGILLYHEARFTGEMSLSNLNAGVYFVQSGPDVRKILISGR